MVDDYVGLNRKEILPSGPARAAAWLPPKSPWSHFALGRALLATGAADEAVLELDARQTPGR